MSELTSTRIREAADRLGLTHLTGHAGDLVARAKSGQVGSFGFLNLVLGARRGRAARAAPVPKRPET